MGEDRKQYEVPPGFVERIEGAVCLWTKPECATLFDESGELRARRDGRPQAGTSGPSDVSAYEGRGEMLRVPLVEEADPGAWAVVRHYRRGGLVQFLMGDRYWGRSRFVKEVQITEQVRRLGVPTVEVLALRTIRSGPGFYKADLVTREIQGSEDLDVYLGAPEHHGTQAGRTLKRRVIQSVALLLGRMHDAEVYHADLNLKNILLQISPERIDSHVIDLDRARLVRGLTLEHRFRNLARLYRSLEKRGHMGRAVTVRDLVLFLRHYSQGDRALMGSCRAWLRREPSAFWLHRFRWKLDGKLMGWGQKVRKWVKGLF